MVEFKLLGRPTTKVVLCFGFVWVKMKTAYTAPSKSDKQSRFTKLQSLPYIHQISFSWIRCPITLEFKLQQRPTVFGESRRNQITKYTQFRYSSLHNNCITFAHMFFLCLDLTKSAKFFVLFCLLPWDKDHSREGTNFDEEVILMKVRQGFFAVGIG